MKEPKRQFRIEDDPDENTLELVQVETSADVKVAEAAEAVVDFVAAHDGPVSTRDVTDAMRGHGGREILGEAFRLLESEDPRRVLTGRRTIAARDGKQRSAKAWWSA